MMVENLNIFMLRLIKYDFMMLYKKYAKMTGG